MLKVNIFTKTEFNRRYKLTIDGKYKGFDRLDEFNAKALLCHKIMCTESRALSKKTRSLGDKMVFSILHHKINIYFI